MPSKLFRSAASAIFFSEIAGDVVGLVGMEVEVEPVLDRMREDAVEQFLEVRHHVGDGAEHALGRGDALRQLAEPGLVAHALDAEQAGGLQLDAARASARASPRTPARRSCSCGGTLSRWVRSALVPWA